MFFFYQMTKSHTETGVVVLPDSVAAAHFAWLADLIGRPPTQSPNLLLSSAQLTCLCLVF